MVAVGKNGISATTSLARNGFVFDWTFHRPRPAALREQSDGPSGSSRRRNERNLPTCRWLNLERGTSVVTCKRRGLLDIARRDIRQLGRDNNRRYSRNRCAPKAEVSRALPVPQGTWTSDRISNPSNKLKRVTSISAACSAADTHGE